MRHNNLVMLAGLLVALVLAGCVSAPERELSLKPASYAGLPNGRDPLNPDQISPVYDQRYQKTREHHQPWSNLSAGCLANC